MQKAVSLCECSCDFLDALLGYFCSRKVYKHVVSLQCEFVYGFLAYHLCGTSNHTLSSYKVCRYVCTWCANSTFDLCCLHTHREYKYVVFPLCDLSVGGFSNDAFKEQSQRLVG